MDIKGTEVLGSVSTEDAVLEHIGALTQMYREQGHYLERIYKWARRVGVEEIRQQIMHSEAQRQGYYQHFLHSQSIAQVDPWQERVQGKDEHEFTPLRASQLEVVA